MPTPLQQQLKAQAVATAINAITGINPVVMYREKAPPLIFFNQADNAKAKAFIENQLKKPADFEIDFFPYVAPIVIKKVLPAAAVIIGAAAFFGYFLGRRQKQKGIK